MVTAMCLAAGGPPPPPSSAQASAWGESEHTEHGTHHPARPLASALKSWQSAVSGGSSGVGGAGSGAKSHWNSLVGRRLAMPAAWAGGGAGWPVHACRVRALPTASSPRRAKQRACSAAGATACKLGAAAHRSRSTGPCGPRRGRGCTCQGAPGTPPCRTWHEQVEGGTWQVEGEGSGRVGAGAGGRSTTRPGTSMWGGEGLHKDQKHTLAPPRRMPTPHVSQMSTERLGQVQAPCWPGRRAAAAAAAAAASSAVTSRALRLAFMFLIDAICSRCAQPGCPGEAVEATGLWNARWGESRRRDEMRSRCDQRPRRQRRVLVCSASKCIRVLASEQTRRLLQAALAVLPTPRQTIQAASTSRTAPPSSGHLGHWPRACSGHRARETSTGSRANQLN